MASSSYEEGPAMAAVQDEHHQPWEYILRKYVLMLATVVATVTYGVGFNPPGGVWKVSQYPITNNRNPIAGAPILMLTSKIRFSVFFLCNYAAFLLSVLVIVLLLILSMDMVEKKDIWIRLQPLRVLMVLNLLCFMVAYAAGTCHDIMFTTVYWFVLVITAAIAYMAQMVLAQPPPTPREENDNIRYRCGHDNRVEERLRKVLMLLATFAVSVTYVAGLSSPPGGFSDNPNDKKYRAGEGIISHGRHMARLTSFFVCNTTAFVASMLIIMLLLSRKVREGTVQCMEMLGCILVALVGLVGAYAAGSSREAGGTTYILAAVAAGLICVKFYACLQKQAGDNGSFTSDEQEQHASSITSWFSSSLLVWLAAFARAMAYQAGPHPHENDNGQMLGEPRHEEDDGNGHLACELSGVGDEGEQEQQASASTCQAGVRPHDDGNGHQLAGEPRPREGQLKITSNYNKPSSSVILVRATSSTAITSGKWGIHLSHWYRFPYEPVPMGQSAPVRGLRRARSIGTGSLGAFVPVRVRNRYEMSSAICQTLGGARAGPLVPVCNTNRYQRVPPISASIEPVPGRPLAGSFPVLPLTHKIFAPLTLQ